MRYKLLILISLLSIFAALYGQYDEKAIMYQSAQQLTFQRQFTQAEQAWQQILQKYPEDYTAITQLFQLYLQINQAEKAEKVLADYRSVLPDNIRMEYEIQLDLQQAKLKEAWDKALAYLQIYPGDENKYRLLAGYFERKSFFEQTIKLYQHGRKALNKADIFMMEMGNSAFYSHQYELAISEYIRFLEVQPGNMFFVSNQLSAMLMENPNLISNLKTLAKSSTSFEVKEVYAISLSRLGKLKEALVEYEQLPTEKLTSFANEQYTAGRDSLAIIAFNALRSRQIDLNTLGEVILKTSEAHIRLRQFAQAESILTEIINPKDKKVNPKYERRRFPYKASLLYADLAGWQNKSVDSVTNWLNEAKKLATGAEDIADVNYRSIGHYFVNEQYDKAEQLLKLQNNSAQIDRNLYYQYLIALANQQTGKADTLLNQLIIAAPASRYVNDLMTLNILMLNLKGQSQIQLLDAFRYRLSHKDSLAIRTVIELSESAKDEELRILAADWAVLSGYKIWAENIFAYDWKDELLKEYATLQRSRLQTNLANAESMAQDFLKSNPNSVFSPGFRQVLQKAPAGRPNL